MRKIKLSRNIEIYLTRKLFFIASVIGGIILLIPWIPYFKLMSWGTYFYLLTSYVTLVGFIYLFFEFRIRKELYITFSEVNKYRQLFAEAKIKETVESKRVDKWQNLVNFFETIKKMLDKIPKDTVFNLILGMEIAHQTRDKIFSEQPRPEIEERILEEIAENTYLATVSIRRYRIDDAVEFTANILDILNRLEIKNEKVILRGPGKETLDILELSKKLKGYWGEEDGKEKKPKGRKILNIKQHWKKLKGYLGKGKKKKEEKELREKISQIWEDKLLDKIAKNIDASPESKQSLFFLKALLHLLNLLGDSPIYCKDEKLVLDKKREEEINKLLQKFVKTLGEGKKSKAVKMLDKLYRKTYDFCGIET